MENILDIAGHGKAVILITHTVGQINKVSPGALVKELQHPAAKMAASLLKVFLAVTFFKFGSGFTCPSNCFCNEEYTECVMLDCESDLYSGYSLRLHLQGKLCPQQVEKLHRVQDHFALITVDQECYGIAHCQ